MTETQLNNKIATFFMIARFFDDYATVFFHDEFKPLLEYHIKTKEFPQIHKNSSDNYKNNVKNHFKKMMLMKYESRIKRSTFFIDMIEIQNTDDINDRISKFSDIVSERVEHFNLVHLIPLSDSLHMLLTELKPFLMKDLTSESTKREKKFVESRIDRLIEMYSDTSDIEELFTVAEIESTYQEMTTKTQNT